MPVVRYAVEWKIDGGKPDYWDYATLLELAVIEWNKADRKECLVKALTSVREKWEAEATARDLRITRESRQARGDQPGWTTEVEQTF